MSPVCDFCSTVDHQVFLPPDMVDPPIEEGEHKGKRMCHFCKYKTDTLIGSDGTKFPKEAVIKDYQKFCEQMYKSPSVYKAYGKAIVDSQAKRAMKH